MSHVHSFIKDIMVIGLLVVGSTGGAEIMRRTTGRTSFPAMPQNGCISCGTNSGSRMVNPGVSFSTSVPRASFSLPQSRPAGCTNCGPQRQTIYQGGQLNGNGQVRVSNARSFGDSSHSSAPEYLSNGGRPIANSDYIVTAVNDIPVPKGSHFYKMEGGSPKFYDAQSVAISGDAGLDSSSRSAAAAGEALPKRGNNEIAEAPVLDNLTEVEKIADELADSVLETSKIETALKKLYKRESDFKEELVLELEKEAGDKKTKAKALTDKQIASVTSEWGAVIERLMVRYGKDNDRRILQLAKAVKAMLKTVLDELGKPPVILAKGAPPTLRCVVCDMPSLHRAPLSDSGFTQEKDSGAKFVGGFASEKGKNYQVFVNPETGQKLLAEGGKDKAKPADPTANTAIVAAINEHYAGSKDKFTSEKDKGLVAKILAYKEKTPVVPVIAAANATSPVRESAQPKGVGEVHDTVDRYLQGLNNGIAQDSYADKTASEMASDLGLPFPILKEGGRYGIEVNWAAIDRLDSARGEEPIKNRILSALKKVFDGQIVQYKVVKRDGKILCLWCNLHSDPNALARLTNFP